MAWTVCRFKWEGFEEGVDAPMGNMKLLIKKNRVVKTFKFLKLKLLDDILQNEKCRLLMGKRILR